jgi:hypothetical protein
MDKYTLAVIIIAALLIGGLSASESAVAQTNKLHKKTTAQGEIDRTPYVTYAEFKAAAVGGKSLPANPRERR